MKKTWLIVTLAFCSVAAITMFIFSNSSVSNNLPLKTLHIAVLPDQSENALREKYAPLLAFLSKYTQRETQLIVPKTYQELIELFAQGKAELAYMGGLTFLQANATSNAKALVMREADTRFSSWFIVQNKSNIERIEQLRGKPFSFGSNLSTSGHLMPRHYLHTEYNIIPETFFEQVVYSNSHDKTVYDVRDGKASGGAVNSIVYSQMLIENRILPNEMKVIWKSPPYPDYVWVVQPTLHEETINALRNAFLSLSLTNASHKRILNKLGAHYFLPAKSIDFDILKGVAIKQNLLVSN